MDIVVTGARGMVGSVLTQRARDFGHNVFAIDQEDPRGQNPIPVREWDCMNGLPPLKADIVVHLAAATGDLARSLDDLRVANVEMLQRVVKSTDALVFWPTTSLALGVPESAYCISKEEGLAWARTQPRVVPLRFFNVSGAYKGCTERRKNEVHLIPKLVEAANTNTPFVINGNDYDTVDGSPSRDFIDVLDVVDGILTLAELKPDWVRRHADGAIWFGTGVPTTVVQAIEYSGLNLEWEFGPRRALDCGALQCDPNQTSQLSYLLDRPLTPALISIRKEVNTLRKFHVSV